MSNYWVEDTVIDVYESFGAVSAGLPIGLVPRGRVFYVSDSSRKEDLEEKADYHTRGWGLSIDKTFKTLEHAISKCRDGRGDTILLERDHEETYDSSSATLSFSKSGITIIGLGRGPSKAKINLIPDGRDCMEFTGNGIHFHNIEFLTGCDGGDTGYTALKMDGDSSLFSACLFNTIATETNEPLTLELNAQNATLIDCRLVCNTSADSRSQPIVELTNDGATGLVVRDCDIFIRDTATLSAVVTAAGVSLEDYLIRDCRIWSDDEATASAAFDIDGFGFICDCRAYQTQLTNFNSGSTTGVVCECYATDDRTKSGKPVPARVT
jgi:hypothetical protein